jgi:holo-[acyl-carrier protein] synthase
VNSNILNELPTVGLAVGHGIDLVELDDFARLLKEPACAFLGRHFTTRELADASQGGNRLEKLAGRFAVKEAVLKVFGVGWGDGIAFTDVEVLNAPSGAPTVSLKRQLETLQVERRICGWLVSVSHTNRLAMASVIAVCSRTQISK